MAFPSETINDGIVAAGPIVFLINAVGYGRVLSYEIDTACSAAEISHGSIDQIIAVIETANGSGKITLTLDEIHDIDTIEGLKANVSIQQNYPETPTAGLKMSAATAYVKVLGYSGGRAGEKSTMRVEVTPYKGVGADPWTFTNADSY